MSWEDREDNTIYKVVVNHEEQYSIWPAHRENPLGWNDVGKSGPQAGVPGLHQGSLDRHAAALAPQEDGRDGARAAGEPGRQLSSVPRS